METCIFRPWMPLDPPDWTEVTSSDYIAGTMKTVGVRDLKARLSEYLRDVKHGETVLVTERGTVVAQLVPLGPGEELSRGQREAMELLREGVVTRLGTQDETEWPDPPAKGVRREDLDAALEWTRGDR